MCSIPWKRRSRVTCFNYYGQAWVQSLWPHNTFVNNACVCSELGFLSLSRRCSELGFLPLSRTVTQLKSILRTRASGDISSPLPYDMYLAYIIGFVVARKTDTVQPPTKYVARIMFFKSTRIQINLKCYALRHWGLTRVATLSIDTLRLRAYILRTTCFMIDPFSISLALRSVKIR